MSNIIPFPLNIRYRALGINRDGRIIVSVINTTRQFLRYAEELLATPELIKHFPKNQVSWICDVSRANHGERVQKPSESNY